MLDRTKVQMPPLEDIYEYMSLIVESYPSLDNFRFVVD
jgi:hypothetical protein